MIWLEKDESIVIEDHILVSVLSISAVQARLAITVPDTLRMWWSESAVRPESRMPSVSAMILSVSDIQHGKICLEVEGPNEIELQRREVFTASRGDKAADFSSGKSVFVIRKQKEERIRAHSDHVNIAILGIIMPRTSAR